jgi:hypothetical protein
MYSQFDKIISNATELYGGFQALPESSGNVFRTFLHRRPAWTTSGSATVSKSAVGIPNIGFDVPIGVNVINLVICFLSQMLRSG